MMMRTKLSITEGIFPMPVLMVATYNEDGSVNVMNAAWGTMQERETVVLNLTETHKTVKNIKARGAFTVSIADAAHAVSYTHLDVYKRQALRCPAVPQGRRRRPAPLPLFCTFCRIKSLYYKLYRRCSSRRRCPAAFCTRPGAKAL